MGLKYKRILLKLSGEALSGEQKFGLDYDVVQRICESIKKCTELGAEVAIVVGGGNFWRGRSSGKMDRTRADHMGMLGTVINALALADALEQLEVPVRVQTAIAMQQVAEPYVRGRAVRHLEKGRVVVLAVEPVILSFPPTRHPLCVRRKSARKFMMKATMVDGVYDKDPHKYDDAVKYDTLTFSEVLNKELAVMDMTAASMCKDNHIPVLVFDIGQPDNLVRAVQGEDIGTLVTEG